MSNRKDFIIMEDDSSKMSITTDSNSNKEHEKFQQSKEERPLMKLFSRLINGHDNKQNTVLTNSQLIEILQKEFKLNIVNIHILEVDIYVNIMKKFLKDWPQWDEFDEIINSHSCKKNKKSQQQLLEVKYLSLKEYLKQILEKCTPLAKETVNKVIRENEEKSSFLKEDSTNTNDIFMEIQCNRRQLNNLIFKCPNPESNNTIFNVIENFVPSRINLNTVDFKTILNWPTVKFSVHLPRLVYNRIASVKYEHRLINNNLKEPQESPEPLDDCLEKRTVKGKTDLHLIEKSRVLKEIKKIKNQLTEDFPQQCQMIRTIFDIINEDICIVPKLIAIPGAYRKNLNRYRYRRYFNKNVPNTNISKYDLHLEETITPSLYVNVLKIITGPYHYKMQTNKDWLRISCGLCLSSFSIDNSIEEIENHFNDLHLSDENDWMCTNCKKFFAVSYLANNKLSHEC